MARPKKKSARQSTINQRKQAQQTLWFILGLAGLAVIILIGVGMLSRSGNKPDTASVIGEVSAQDKSLGNPNAPVVVTDFSDFHCPHCRTFAETTEKQLIKQYVKSGKVRLEYKHFIVVNSELAANASECAREQGKFWEYHDYLFSKQETDAPFTTDELKRYAQDLGLNTQQFDECVDSGKYMDVVMKETNEGRRLGVRGTPTIFVNGKLVPRGALWPDLKAAIDEALQKSGQGS